jgi:hypothetical protein
LTNSASDVLISKETMFHSLNDGDPIQFNLLGLGPLL